MKSRILNKVPELAKVSSKGQIVIPQSYRKRLKIHEGNVFAVTSSGKDMIVLKKIKNPLLKADLATLKNIKEAWEEIESGEFKRSGKEEFLKELKEW